MGEGCTGCRVPMKTVRIGMGHHASTSVQLLAQLASVEGKDRW